MGEGGETESVESIVVSREWVPRHEHKVYGDLGTVRLGGDLQL